MAEVILDQVSKNFGKTIALDKVSMTIPDQSFVVLLGPTGAGKTTTLRMVSGLDRLDGGGITIDGTNVSDTHRRNETWPWYFSNIRFIRI